MRTTVRLDEQLLADAKRLAIRTNRTLTEVIEDSVREAVARAKEMAPRRTVDFPTYGGGGVAPGVDLSSNAAVQEFLDEGRSLDKLR